jgi:hypothetical protein
MTCTIIAALVSCVAATPAPSPAEAAAILAPYQFVYVAPLPPGPRVIGIYSSPTAGPFGEFPARRWDGTSYVDPWSMTTYPWFYGFDGGYGRTRRGHAGGDGRTRLGRPASSQAPRVPSPPRTATHQRR